MNFQTMALSSENDVLQRFYGSAIESAVESAAESAAEYAVY